MNSSEKQNPKITPCYPHVIPMLSHGFTVPHCQAPPDSATAEVPDSAPQAGADSGAGSVRRPSGGPGEAQGRPRGPGMGWCLEHRSISISIDIE